MWSIPDMERAGALRRSFTATVIADWRKVLLHLERRSVLPGRHVRLLVEALDEASLTGPPSRSEFFHLYLRALDAVNRGDLDGARTLATSLGNVLLQDAAEGRISGALPVDHDGAGVRLPAAAPDARLRVAPQDGVLGPAAIRAAAGEIREAIEATWALRSEVGRTVGVRGLTGPVAGEIAKYETRMHDLSGQPADLRLLDVEEPRGLAVAAGLQAGYAYLDTVDPQLAAELAVITEYVVPLQGSQLVGGSDIILYGASFLCLRPEWSTLCFADHLVHEEAHQVLHAAQELDPLLVNRDQIGQPSPIRADARPLYGTFHATFVFLRLASFMRKVVASGESGFGDEPEVRLHRHLLGLLQGLRILVDHAELTGSGRAELDSWIETAADLVAFAGQPERRLYARLNQDYQIANDELPLLTV